MRRSLFLILLIVLTITFIPIRGQEYWIGLNFKLNFLSEGSLIITIKMHPFKASGESLYGDERIFNEMKNAENSHINDALLLISTDPAKLKYEVIKHFERDDDEIVLCDVYNKGVMERLKGAYIIMIKVYLNTSDLLEKIDEDVYRITIVDSFTSRDPRSWIDVLNISFGENVGLKKYDWIPSSAHGPSKIGKNYLLWINFNEPQAPNKYILTLSLPDFHYTEAVSASASIVDYSVFSKDDQKTLNIVVKNDSPTSIFFLVRFTYGGIDMARKIFIESNKMAEISFNIPNNIDKGYVEIWFEKNLLERIEVSLGAKSGFDINEFLQNRYMILPLTLFLIGIFLILLSLILTVRSRHRLEESYPVAPQIREEHF